jgi:hypothetical protein
MAAPSLASLALKQHGNTRIVYVNDMLGILGIVEWGEPDLFTLHQHFLVLGARCATPKMDSALQLFQRLFRLIIAGKCRSRYQGLIEIGACRIARP